MAKKRLRGASAGGDPTPEDHSVGRTSARAAEQAAASAARDSSSSAPPAAPSSRTKRQRTVLPSTASHSHSHSTDPKPAAASAQRAAEKPTHPPPTEQPAVTGKPPGVCSCKASKCIKLYCECFAVGKQCTVDCRCLDCKNNVEHDDVRNAAIVQILSRNPRAFAPKVRDDEAGGVHARGCRCKKSACQKAYCECFAAKIPCTSKCRCVGCKNGAPDDHSDHNHGPAGSASQVSADPGASRAAASAKARSSKHSRGPGGSMSNLAAVAVAVATLSDDKHPHGNEPGMTTPSRPPRVEYTDASPEMRGARTGVSPAGGSSASLLAPAANALATPNSSNALFGGLDGAIEPPAGSAKWRSPLFRRGTGSFGPIGSSAPSPATPVSVSLAQSAARREAAGLASPVGHLLSTSGPGTVFSPVQMANPAALQSGLMSPGGLSLTSLPLPSNIDFDAADNYTPMKGMFSPARLLPSVLRNRASRYTSEPASDLATPSRPGSAPTAPPAALDAPGATATNTTATTTTATTTTTTATTTTTTSETPSSSTATADLARATRQSPDSQIVPPAADGAPARAAGDSNTAGDPVNTSGTSSSSSASSSSHSFPILSVPGEEPAAVATTSAASAQPTSGGKYTSTPVNALPWSLNGDPSTTLTRAGQQVVLDTGGSGAREVYSKILAGPRALQLADHLMVSTPVRSSDAGVPATPSSAGSAGSLTPGFGFGPADGLDKPRRAAGSSMGPPASKPVVPVDSEAAVLGSLNNILSHVSGARGSIGDGESGPQSEPGSLAPGSRGASSAEAVPSDVPGVPASPPTLPPRPKMEAS